MSTTSWTELLKDSQSAGGFAPIPDGDYDLKILDVTAKTTSTGKPMFELKAEIQTGPHAKRLVWDRLVVSKDSPKALQFFFRKMAALGLTEEFFAQGPDDSQIVQALHGRTFRGKLGIREYQGKQSNEITEYYSAAQAQAYVAAPPVYAPPAVATAPPAPPIPGSPWTPTVVPQSAPAPAPTGFVAPPNAPF